MLSQSDTYRRNKNWNFITMISSRRPSVARPPSWTLSELAARFGVTPNSLKAYMQHHPGAPAPTTSGRVKHYPLPEMEKWWNETILSSGSVSHSLLASDN
jgi:hypothetical protein